MDTLSLFSGLKDLLEANSARFSSPFSHHQRHSSLYSSACTLPDRTGLPSGSTSTMRTAWSVSVRSMPRAASPFGTRMPTYCLYGLSSRLNCSELNAPLGSNTRTGERRR